MLDTWAGYLNQVVALVGPDPTLQAGIIVILAVFFAFIARTVIRRVCRRWAARSATDVDDRFLAIVERPIFMTVLLVGFTVAVHRFGMPQSAEFVTVGALKSIGILIWASFALRLSRQILELLARARDRFPLVDDRTQPLLQNLSALVVGIGTIYAFMNAWG
ncbi:MAG: hypothetical protein AB8G17_21765, partial [Gammaproteobacteria bacterium]